MGNYKAKTQGENAHLGNLTSARYVHVDGSVATPIIVRATMGRLLKVVLNTNGATIALRDGSDLIGTIAADAPEQTFEYGVYCNNNINVVCGGAVSATIVFAA